MSPPKEDWPAALHRVLKGAKVAHMSYVPDAGHARLIDLFLADPDMVCNVLTTEEEGVAIAAGAWLGGERSVLLMQSSGVGNCINMLSLPAMARFPLLMLVTMRGEWGEFNPWQLAMGQGTPPALQTAGVVVQRVDHAEEVREHVFAAAQLTFNTSRPVALLISQRIVGFKDWSK